MSRINRRRFLSSSAAAIGAGAAAASASAKAPEILVRRPHPCVVSSANGYPHCTSKAMEGIIAGKPVVDAVVEGVTLVENDPKDMSVGYGGLPNEEGVVQLDASVMDGVSCLSGAVGCIENIKNPAKVALHVMRYTDHCLIVGEGAKRFAKAHGFKEENLLTERARKAWLRWKASLSERDDWFPKDTGRADPDLEKVKGTYGTINCNGVNSEGDVAGVTTTSGLSWKIPGRVGDSPIIGAGLYVDGDHGAAGSTGRGEANIISCGSFSVVEAIRKGMHPKDACVYAARNIVRLTRAKHLVRKDGKPNFNVKFYAVDKKGRHGGAAIWSGGKYAAFDADGNRRIDFAYALER
ncbi:MAG: N(4)-(beta-N-acetylglucosaminyl)-L-asparaginase [Planctomycetes bacterium]|nr:N(4)-(beta-N-acetylglucosaminyl)-L-asparaginase [Planctomycetota bacterium]